MTRLLTSGRVHIRELLDLVGASEDDPKALEERVRQVYDWHNGRSVAGMQLTFAPAATAVLAIVAKPDSTLVVIAASSVVAITLILGVFQLVALNWLHGEYAYAIRLTRELPAFHSELAAYPHGIGAPAGSTADVLYNELGSISMVTYRADPACRERVLERLSQCRADTT